jgi:pimeloyl-ACP methyl ester carboxylesterase
MSEGALAIKGVPDTAASTVTKTIRRAADYDFACFEAGHGTPVLLLHGSLCDGRYFGMQMTAFGRCFHAVAPSLRHCHPERWDGRGPGYSIERHVADMAALIATLGGPVHLLGHSRGARVAFQLAAQHPGLVRRLVLAEPGGPVDAALAAEAPDLLLAPNRATATTRATALIADGRIDEGLELFIDAANGAGAWVRLPSRAKDGVRDNAGTLRAQAREMPQPLTRADAAGIQAETLLVRGALSPPPFGDVLDALAAAMPHARSLTIADASHTMNTTGADAFNRGVLAFLTEK